MTLFDHQALRNRIAARAGSVSLNDIAPVLVARAMQGEEAELTVDGAVSVRTGGFTGRSPKDKFIVRDETTENTVWWDNAGAMSPANFTALLDDAVEALGGHGLFRQDLLAGADPRHQHDVTVLTPSAWHALFIRNLLIRPGEMVETGSHATDVTIVHVPHFRANPARHGCRSETVIALDMSRNIVVIAGTSYAGEIKKSVFSLFNFHAPAR